MNHNILTADKLTTDSPSSVEVVEKTLEFTSGLDLPELTLAWVIITEEKGRRIDKEVAKLNQEIIK